MLAPRVRKNGDGKEFQFLPDLAVCTCPLADLTRFSPSNLLLEVFLLSLPFVSSPVDTLLLILQFLISKLKSIENVVFEVAFTVVPTVYLQYQLQCHQSFHYHFQHDHFHRRLHLQNNLDPRQSQLRLVFHLQNKPSCFLSIVARQPLWS